MSSFDQRLEVAVEGSCVRWWEGGEQVKMR